jgi:hypothetical protein
MKKGQTKKAADAANADKPPYKPTPIEIEAVAAYLASRDKRGPRLKVATNDKATSVEINHPDLVVGQIALMKADPALASCFISPSRKSPSPKADERGINFMLAVVKGIDPRDQIEAMLAAQIAAVHMATMTFARRLAHVENIPQQDAAERAFNKLARTFAAQVSALKDYRSRGEQRMVVQHVNVAEGGQAIVGNVNAPASRGVGATEKAKEQPHELAYAPGIAMPCQIEAERATVPSAGSAGI